MRLIDADKLKGKAFADPDDGEHFVYCQDIDEAPTVDAVPLSELTALRDTLYDMDAITFRGLSKLNQLISKYGGNGMSNTIPDERLWLETV